MQYKRKHTVILLAALVACVAVAMTFSGRRAKASLAEDSSIRLAAVALAARTPLEHSITLSGEFRPFQVVDVHAKVAGCIRRTYVDVGGRVRTGLVLAVLEVPELSAQLQGADAAVRRARDAIRRSKSNMSRAESLHQATHLYTRLREAAQTRPGLVAQQELDNAEAKDKDAEAQVSADGSAL